MQKRQIGTSELYVSEIGLGCMSLGKDQKQATVIINEAVDRGINYFDTADLYDFGLNEELVGNAIKRKRNELILATKVGNRWENGQDGWYWDPSKKHIQRAVKDSLRRLQTDYIDLYQLHGGTIEDHIDETIDAFEELKKEGVIRYYGISSIRPNVIREYIKKANIVSVMMQYSILDRRPEEEILALLEEHRISLIARGPLAKGLLTERSIEDAGARIQEKGYLNYSFAELKDVIIKLKQETSDRRLLTETAIQYCLYNKSVASVIPGASKIEQVIANSKATFASPLTVEEFEKIQEISKANTYEKHR